jgi:AcrR family transcriptional regulator
MARRRTAARRTSSGTAPRKLPRQARSRETFDAIVDACARILRTRDYARVTTNHVAERAGVSIGTLYEFFPNKEAIVATLIERRFGALLAQVARDIDAAYALGGRAGLELLLRRIVDLVSSDRELYRALLRAPEVQEMAVTRQAIAAFFELARTGAGKPRAVDLPHLDADAWLISRMMHAAVLEIAFHDGPDPDPRLLTSELVRLASRMILGRDEKP